MLYAAYATDTNRVPCVLTWVVCLDNKTCRSAPNTSQRLEASAWCIHSLSPICRTNEPATGAVSQVCTACASSLLFTLALQHIWFDHGLVFFSLYKSVAHLSACTSWMTVDVSHALRTLRVFSSVDLVCVCLLPGRVGHTCSVSCITCALLCALICTAHMYRLTNQTCCYSCLLQPGSIRCSRRRHSPSTRSTASSSQAFLPQVR